MNEFLGRQLQRKTMKTKGSQRSFGTGGAVSSVVEHFLDTEGVRGSNPLSRTILHRTYCAQRLQEILAPPLRRGEAAQTAQSQVQNSNCAAPSRSAMVCRTRFSSAGSLAAKVTLNRK